MPATRIYNIAKSRSFERLLLVLKMYLPNRNAFSAHKFVSFQGFNRLPKTNIYISPKCGKAMFAERKVLPSESADLPKNTGLQKQIGFGQTKFYTERSLEAAEMLSKEVLEKRSAAPERRRFKGKPPKRREMK